MIQHAQAILDTIGRWNVDLLVFATVLLGPGMAVCAIARSAALRVAIGRWQLIGLAFLVVLSLIPGRQHWGIRAVASSFSGQPALANAAIRLPAHGQSDLTLPCGASVGAEPLPSSESKFLLGDSPLATVSAWQIAGAFCILCYAGGVIWNLFGIIAVRKVRATRMPLDPNDDVAKSIGRLEGLFVSRQVPEPMALGLFRPIVLIPERMIGELSPEALCSVIDHERSHIESGDLWWTLLGSWLLPIYCLNPLFWLTRPSLRADMEVLADLAAAGKTKKGRITYAETLLQLGSWSVGRPSCAAANVVTLGQWRRPLRRRVAAILDSRNACVQVRRPITIACATMTCVLALAASTLTVSATAKSLCVSASAERPPTAQR